MSDYKRRYQSGGRYFFTVVTFERKKILTEPASIALLKAAIGHTRQKYPFTIEAIVILPDHLHCLWRLPDGDDDFSTRWRLIKTYFSRSVALPANRRGEKQVWQRRFWEHVIRDDRDWRNYMDYVFYNPVKHGLADRVIDWPYSSFQRVVERGWYSRDWGSVEPESISGLNLE